MYSSKEPAAVGGVLESVVDFESTSAIGFAGATS